MSRDLTRHAFVTLLLTLTAAPLAAEERFAQEIAQFVAADQKNPPAEGGVVFVGSSSIRMWSSLAQDFPGVPVLQRGFGGSQMADSVKYADQIVLPYKPRMVVVYAGDNDLAGGKTPEQVLADYQALVGKIHAALPETRVGFIAVKPSLARWKLIDQVKQTNALIAEYSAQDPRLVFFDIFTPMLGGDGLPRKELFLGDGLHMTPAGYALWTAVIAPKLK